MEQTKNYEVMISPKAMQMLVSNAKFLAEADENAALSLVEEFQKTAQSLEILPKCFPWLKGDYIPSSTYRFAVFKKRYMLVFQIVEDTVYVDYVLDCRQDYQWLLK